MVAFPGDGPPGEYLVHFMIENTGLRSLTVHSVSWRVGWLTRGPESLRYLDAIQAGANASPFVNLQIEPSLTGQVSIPVRIMNAAFVGEDPRSRYFQRRHPLLGQAPIKAFANVAGRQPIKLAISKELITYLRKGHHPEYMAKN